MLFLRDVLLDKAHALAGVLKLVDKQDLGSCAFMRVGSSPTARTSDYPSNSPKMGEADFPYLLSKYSHRSVR